VATPSSAYHFPRDGDRARLGPGELWLVRRPFACRRADLTAALAAAEAKGPGAMLADGLSAMLARAGVTTEIVPAPSWNIKITTPDDWAIEQGLHPV
jgi:2-C-methyl-D-erythritol 4-phosphate cytidylyltransferase